MNIRFCVVCWLVCAFALSAVVPCARGASRLAGLDEKYEEAKAKIEEPLNVLRVNYRAHLKNLQKEFAANGGTKTAGEVAAAAAAGDPDPEKLSTIPKLRKAEELFLTSRDEILTEIKPRSDSLRETYLKHLKKVLEGLSSVDDQEESFAVAERIATLEREVEKAIVVEQISTLRGSFHCCVDDSASIYVKGERVLRAKLGNNKSDVVELNVGDDVVFSARNGGGGAKCFKIAFISEDGKHVITFKAPDLKVIDDEVKERAFPVDEIESITQVVNVRPGSGSGIKAEFPFADECDWVWDEGGLTIMAAVIKPEMIRSTSGDGELLATVSEKKEMPVERPEPVRVIPKPKPRTKPKSEPAPDPEFVDNFDAEWPVSASTDVSAVVAVVSEDAEGEKFVYHSNHFEFISDARLSLNVIRKLSRLFEATLEYCKALPVATQKAHHAMGEKRHRILLFRKESDYYKNGGPPGSAGVFMGDKGVVMVPLKHVGVLPAGSGYRVDYDKKNKTLPHEIVHQLTDGCYYRSGSRGWFTEGLAEYVALTPYSNSGTFKIRGNRDPIALGVTAYGEDGDGGRALGKKIRMRPLSEWMKMPYEDFTGPGIGKNYGMAALVVYYFFHMDRDGDRTAINAFLKGLRAGKRGQEALDELLGGRTWPELAEAIHKGWRSRGIDIIWEEETTSGGGD